MPQLRLFMKLDLGFLVALSTVAIIACFFSKAYVAIVLLHSSALCPTRRCHVSQKLLLQKLIFTSDPQIFHPSCPPLLPFLKRKNK